MVLLGSSWFTQRFEYLKLKLGMNAFLLGDVYYYLIPAISTFYLICLYLLRNRKSLLGLSPIIFFILIVGVVALYPVVLVIVGYEAPYYASNVFLSLISDGVLAFVLLGIPYVPIVIPGFVIFTFFKEARDANKPGMELALLILYLVIAMVYVLSIPAMLDWFTISI